MNNHAFRVNYLDNQILKKPQVLNLVQAVNKLGNKKCVSLLGTMGLVKPESSDQSMSVQKKPHDKPARKVIQSPEKEVPKKESDVIQVMSTTDIRHIRQGLSTGIIR